MPLSKLTPLPEPPFFGDKFEFSPSEVYNEFAIITIPDYMALFRPSQLYVEFAIITTCDTYFNMGYIFRMGAKTVTMYAEFAFITSMDYIAGEWVAP